MTLTSAFDADTALDPAGEGRWRAHAAANWFVEKGPNGGFLAALAVRALAETTDRPPRSLTLHYLEAPVEGELEVRTEVRREGRSTTAVQVEIHQDGKPVTLALAACGDARDGQPEWDDAVRPDMPPPEECDPFDTSHPRAPAFFRNYELRWKRLDPEERPATVRGWLRPTDPRPVDAVLLAALTDALVPPAFMRMSERLFVPTIDLTIHFRDRPPEGAHPWVLGVFSTRVGGGGVCEEDGELWSEDGRLLAQSRQLAIVRRPR
jgi:acyl-CoA thioesterase